MTSSSRVAKLTKLITANTKIVDDYFNAKKLPALSFAEDGPADFPVQSSNHEIQKARREVVNATKELHDLMVTPREKLRWMAWDYNDNLSLHVVNEFKIAHAVPLNKSISFADLSAAVGIDQTNIKRLVRHAMTNRIFQEPEAGFVAHTAASRVLRDDPMMEGWVGTNLADFFPAAASTVKAMVKHPNSQEPSETGFSLAHGPGSMFAIYAQDPARAQRFGKAMVSMTTGEGYEISCVVDGFSWAELGEGVVVDVGGSVGFVCVELAKKFPKLRFVVQDNAPTIAKAPSQCPPELLERIEFQTHDYYSEQPVKNADVYFFRWIFHNQSDKYAVKLLRALIPALKPGAKIVICDNCLPEPNTNDMWDEKITRSVDCLMLSLLNSKERGDSDWKDLFAMVDSRFKYLGSKRPDGSRMSIMEAVWQPDSS